MQHDVHGVLRDRLDHDRLRRVRRSRACGTGRSGPSGREAGRRGCGRRTRTPAGRHRSSPTGPGRDPSPRRPARGCRGGGRRRRTSRSRRRVGPARPRPRAAGPGRRRTRPGRAAAAAAGGLSRTDRCWVTSVTVRDFNAKHGSDRKSGPTPHGHVTLGDVARHVGVSAQSVSNALNSPDRVAPATRDRILAAVHELGYRPNRSARALRNQRSRLIGVKVEASRDDRAALLLDQFLHALAESAGAAGCHLILCHADDEAGEIAAYRDLLATTAVDAFVLASTHTDDARVAALRELDVPFATFGRSWDGDEDLAWVDVDGRAGIRAATEHVAGAGPPPDRARRLAARLRDRPRPAPGLARGARRPRPRARPARRGARRLRRRPRRRPPAARRARPGHRDRLLVRHPRPRRPPRAERPWPAGRARRRGHRLRQLPRRRPHHARADQPAPAPRAGRPRPGRRRRADARRHPHPSPDPAPARAGRPRLEPHRTVPHHPHTQPGVGT